MKKRTTENIQPEPKLNSEQQTINNSSAKTIANTHVVRCQSLGVVPTISNLGIFIFLMALIFLILLQLLTRKYLRCLSSSISSMSSNLVACMSISSSSPLMFRNPVNEITEPKFIRRYFRFFSSESFDKSFSL